MIGRKKELKFLNEQFEMQQNSMVILYGRKGIGKTTLVTEFLRSKSGFYYCAKDCSEQEQQLLMKAEWQNGENLKINGDGYIDILRAALARAPKGAKLIIVIDEMYAAIRQGDNFIEALKEFWEENSGMNNLMLVLSTSSVQWVENSMVKTMGSFAAQITGWKKLYGFGFLEIVNRFPGISSKEAVYIYGILGGVPGYMDMWNPNDSIKENIISLFLDKNSLMYHEPENFLKSELRELALYNTILANLACGRQKLNQLYERTGFSRAKISVYLKNLIEFDVVEKVFSYDAVNHENVQKGLYGIKDPLIHFWYRFVFPNLSALEAGESEYVYDNIVYPGLEDYLHKYFVSVCREYCDLLNVYKKLPVTYDLCESWYGKEGNIDLIAKDNSSDSIIIGSCKWSLQAMDEEDFNDLLSVMVFSGIDADYYYLFSESGFTDSLKEKAAALDNLVLTDLDSF